MTVYESLAAGGSDRHPRVREAIKVLERHQSVSNLCAACGTPSPCCSPEAADAREIVTLALKLPVRESKDYRPRPDRANTLGDDPVTVRVEGEAFQARGSRGSREGGGGRSVIRTGAPLNRRTFPRRRVVGIAVGDPARLKRLQQGPGAFASDR